MNNFASNIQNSTSNTQHSPDNYRYPGSRPFQDTDHDRRIFFGREQEAESLLHLILAENLVVLFAKSGMGKTSLLNAGVLQPLRERGFLPLKIRFRDPNIDPLQAFYNAIEETVALSKIEYKVGEKTTLWHYFKSVEFWKADDTLLTPLLILDQFEEFFHLYLPERRKAFISQFADLVKGRKPQTFQENESAYTEAPPNVKVIISIREDFIGQLEEMAREIPAILQNRFRILPLNREQARQAIIEPARIEDDTFHTIRFHYAPDAVDAMLDFLCKRRERDEILLTDEVESFQLQLLCQHLEQLVSQKAKSTPADITVEKSDLGGESGMQRVLENFYEDQIRGLHSELEKRTVHNLCEQGLISASDRRLSLEEEEIDRQYGISKNLLVELVNTRLLRAEPRVGSVYYELSHDTLVEPIRNAQKRHQEQKNRMSQEISELDKEAGRLTSEGKIKDAIAKYTHIIELDDTCIWAYLRIGRLLVEQRKLDDAVNIYKQAIQKEIHHADIYHHLARALNEQGEEDSKEEQEGAVIDTEGFTGYTNSSEFCKEHEKFDEAIENYEVSLEMNSRNREAYKELALLYIKTGQPEKAITVYQRSLQIEPEYARIYSDLVKGLEQQGVKESITQIYEMASHIELEDASYYNELGRVFHAQGKYEQAKTLYTKALQINPNYIHAYNNLGLVFHNKGEYERAIQYYYHALQIDSKYTRAYTNLAFTFNQQSRYDKVIEICTQAIDVDPKYALAYHWFGNALTTQGKYTEAITYHQKAIEFAPNAAYPYNGMGNNFLKQSLYDQAIENFQKAIQVDPKYALVYANLGWTFNNQSKYDEAIQHFQQAIKLSPNLVYAYTGIAFVYRMQGRYNEAIASCQKAIELVPHLPDGYSGLGGILSSIGKYNEAMENHKKAIELSPQSAYPYNSLGISLLIQGKYKESIKNFQKAIQLNAKHAYAYGNWGNALRNQGKYEKAVQKLQQAIELTPNLAFLHNGLGFIFQAQGRFAEAVLAHRKAITLAPNATNYYSGLGVALGKQGHYEEAHANHKKAIELTPNVADPYIGLGYTLLRQKKYDEAKECFQQALRLEPQSAFAYEGLAGVCYELHNYADAYDFCKKAYSLNSEHISTKIHFALINVIIERFDTALCAANEVLNEQDISALPLLVMWVISISCLLFQQRRIKAFNEVSKLIQYYNSLAGDYNGSDDKNDEYKEFISSTDKLSEADKTLLLTLIDILETPKPQADSKLNELETLLEQLKQP